jgi:hypothetical protein
LEYGADDTTAIGPASQDPRRAARIRMNASAIIKEISRLIVGKWLQVVYTT